MPMMKNNVKRPRKETSVMPPSLRCKIERRYDGIEKGVRMKMARMPSIYKQIILSLRPLNFSTVAQIIGINMMIRYP